MAKKYFIIFIALIVILSACKSSQKEWQSFTSANGRFKALFPGNVAESKQNVPTAVGEIELIIFTYTSDSGVYMIGYCDYPESIISASNPDTLLQGAKGGAIGNVDGTIEKEEKIELSGYPGLEVKFTIPATKIPGGGKAKAMFFMVKNRLYQVLAMGKPSNSESDYNKFLDSFQFQ